MPYLGNELATQFQAFVTQTITGDGSTGYTLDRAVANGKELLVYINNVKQEEGSGKSYTASGTTITFSEAVASTDSCYVVFLGSAVQTVTPPDGSLASYTGNASISGTLGVTGAVTASSGLDVTGAITASSASSINVTGGSALTLKSTDAGSTAGPVLSLQRDSASPADNDLIGKIIFSADDDGGNSVDYATVNIKATDVSDGSEDGEFDISTVVGGTSRSRMRADGSETIFNENSVDVDFRVESDGNASMLFVNAGDNAVLVGKTSADNSTAGQSFFGSDGMSTTRSGGVALIVNRLSDDGQLVNFRQANSDEGSISVSGSTISYNGFSGLHESSGIATNTPIGTVVSTIDELDVYALKQGEAGEETDNPKAGQTRADHAKVKVSDTAGDKAVYGVVGSFNAQEKVNVISVGIGSVRVTGACAKGDLLESNGDGTAKVQSDDIVRSKTIGKVTIGNSNTGVKLVSCVLYCG